jgi:hypothetical protein
LKRLKFILLVARAFWELVRYDLIDARLGFRHVYRQLERQCVARGSGEPAVAPICEAVTLATCLYWKRVYCLQRSVAAARLLRKSGIHGRLVIGYKPSPFLSHAWVEVDGRVVNDSPVYKQRMRILCTI